MAEALLDSAEIPAHPAKTSEGENAIDHSPITAPPERSDSASPPPDVSPTLAASACPPLDRSVSTASSTASSISDIDYSGARSTASNAVNKRRGYMRPQATNPSESAKNRESVMSLGSIAHLQYYFARTGLLDGKGAQLARSRKPSENQEEQVEQRKVSGAQASSDLPRTPPKNNRNTMYFDSSLQSLRANIDNADESGASPQGQTEEPEWNPDSPAMLPPTVSTYKHKPIFTAPAPDVRTLRKELLEAVEDACKVLEELHKSKTPSAPSTPSRHAKTDSQSTVDGRPPTDNGIESPERPKKNFDQIQGLHILDVTTLAIRAAKNYYTAHERPKQLYQIKSERAIRSELFEVLEVLKRMAGRNFAGGIKTGEQNAILIWILGISDLLKAEEDMERQEQEERERWRWRSGDWTGREREREWLFLKSLLTKESQDLPEWTDASETSQPQNGTEAEGNTEGEVAAQISSSPSLPTPFLEQLRTGTLLIQAHNAAVRASRRQFELITKVHEDTSKPYRRAENLRFFIKAAERRWELSLTVDVASIASDARGKEVHDKAWRGFDAAIQAWCKGVREEVVRDWEQKEKERSRDWDQKQKEKQQKKEAVRDEKAADLTPKVDPSKSPELKNTTEIQSSVETRSVAKLEGNPESESMTKLEEDQEPEKRTVPEQVQESNIQAQPKPETTLEVRKTDEPTVNTVS